MDSNESAETSAWTRRSFVVGAGAAAAGVAVAGLAWWPSGEGRAVRYFDVVHDDDVYVTMTNGASFEVAIKQRGTGEVLERHRGVTATNLVALDSERLQIVER